MNDHPNIDRAAERPSVGEIAALARRLRELSSPGQAVEPGERAAFLAYKDALIARITDTHAATGTDAAADRERHQHVARIGRTDQAAEGGWWARAASTDPAAEAVTFDSAGYYSDAQLAAIADARAVGDIERAERLQNAPRSALANDVGVPAMPDWMRDQARCTEPEIADGTYVAGPSDDMARLADRLAALRGQADPDAAGRSDQLARWHHDDDAAEAELSTDHGDSGYEDAPGWDR